MFKDKIRHIREIIQKIDISLEMQECSGFKQADKQLLKLQEDIIVEFEEDIKSIREAIVKKKKYINESSIYEYIENLKRIRSKLKSYAEYLEIEEKKMDNSINKMPNINITNTNTNTNDNTNTNTNSNTNLKIIFDEVRKQIQEDEYMSEDEIKEVLEKINEIENINNVDEPKNKKWFKLKPILKWIGTKGLTTGTAILSLITAILKAKS